MSALSYWWFTPGARKRPRPPAVLKKVCATTILRLRVLSAEAVDRGPVPLGPDDVRALGVDIELVDADPDAAEGCELNC